jgi:hypothetical protein
MTNSKGPSQYFFTDKNIFDGLMQGKPKVTRSKLIDFLRQRGIFISSDATQKDIALYISTTFIDYYDFQSILELRGNVQRKEKITSSTVKANATSEAIVEICQQVRNKLIGEGEVCKATTHGSTTVIEISYEDVDYSKTDLIQRSNRKIEIEVEKKDDDTIIFRHPANEKAEHISSLLVENLSVQQGEQLKKG